MSAHPRRQSPVEPDDAESAEIYRSAFDAGPEATFIADRHGRYIAANRAAAELTGYPRQTLVGMTRRDLIAAPSASTLRRRDGRQVPVEIDVSPLPGGRQLETIRDASWRRAYQRLQESEAEYRSLVESVRDPMFTSDAEGRYLWVNTAAAAALGTTPENVIGKTAADFFPPRFAEAYAAGARRVIETGIDRVVEDTAEIDGRTRWFYTIVQPVRDRSGDIVAVQAVVRDITERKQMEDALRQSEERLRQAVRVANIGIFDHDHLTNDMYWSPELRAIQGWSQEEPVGGGLGSDGLPPTSDLPHPDDRARINAAMFRAHDPKGDGLFDIEFRSRHRDGSYRWLTVRSQTIFEGEGAGRRAVRTIGAVRDVTSLKQAEQALAESEGRLQQVIDVSHIGVFDHDHVEKTMYLSPSMRMFVGLTPDEPVSGARYEPRGEDPPAAVEAVHPKDRARVAAKIARAHKEGGIYEDEHRLIGRDDVVRWVAVRARTRVEGEGDARRPVRTVGAMLDITERRRAEEERERLLVQLVQAQKMESVGRLAGGVAHDFNNMLNVICGYAEMALERLEPGDPLHRPIEGIRMAGRRSAEFTARLLAFARRQAATPCPLDLNDCVEKSLDIVRRLIGEDIRAVWEPGSHLWSVRMDPGQVDQVLMNLAANARDAIDGVGHLTLRTANVVLGETESAQYEKAAPGDYVMLEVRDDGCGMDAETKSHIFEPFYTTKADGQGTGLGLATVYGIVKQNDGYIRVISEPNQGTTIRMLWARCSGEVASVVSPAAVTQTRGGTETVLLVEDEPMVLDLSRQMLESLGYVVIAAASPGEALRVADLRGGEIDLLVTDVVMPEMHGPELARRLQASFPHLKCLFVSAYFADSGSKRAALDEGIDFLQKPFSLTDLAARVRQTLETP